MDVCAALLSALPHRRVNTAKIHQEILRAKEAVLNATLIKASNPMCSQAIVRRVRAKMVTMKGWVVNRENRGGVKLRELTSCTKHCGHIGPIFGSSLICRCCFGVRVA